MFLITCIGCATKMTNRNSEMFSTFDDFKPGSKGGVDLIWSTPRITNHETLKNVLASYDNIILDQVRIIMDKESSSVLNDNKIKLLTEYMAKELKSKLWKHYDIVGKLSKNTLRLTIVLTNIETPNPILAVTSSISPVGLGISIVSKIVSGDHLNVGQATIEMLISDANTNEPLLAVIDRRSGNKDLGTIIDSTDDVEDAIRWWVKNFLESPTLMALAINQS